MSNFNNQVSEQMKMYKNQLVHLNEYQQFFKKHKSYEDMKEVILIKKYLKLCRRGHFVMSYHYSWLNKEINKTQPTSVCSDTVKNLNHSEVQ